MNGTRALKVIAVTGGKGGVGKTHVSVNLSVALSRHGHRVMLMDADLGLANVDVVLGLEPRGDLSDVVAGARALDDIVVDGPSGIRVVPSASGVQRMAALSESEHAGLIGAFSALREPLDYMVVDTAAGISPDVLAFGRAAEEVLVVLCDEPASLTDAYALIKTLSRDHGIDRFHVLANMVRNADHGRALYRKIATVAERFLDIVVRYAGYIPFDESLRRAVHRQQSVLEAFPDSPAAGAFARLARQVESWPAAEGPHGGLQFFVERLVERQRAE